MGETLAAANDRIVREFLAAWDRRDTAAIVDRFTDDGVYHSTPLEPIVGKDAIRAFAIPVHAVEARGLNLGRGTRVQDRADGSVARMASVPGTGISNTEVVSPPPPEPEDDDSSGTSPRQKRDLPDAPLLAYGADTFGRRYVALGAVIVVLAVAALPSSANALGRAPGGVTIHEDLICATRSNAAQVTPPFSISITGLRPNSVTARLYVTDKDAQPDIVYGPLLIPDVDIRGETCLNVLNAPTGTWKVEVVEQGSGFTDSKVFKVVGGTTPTTVPSTTTTELVGEPPTSLPTTTTTDPDASTTTTEPSTTTSEPPAVTLPWEQLPWVLGAFTSVPIAVTELPNTGLDVGATVAVVAALSFAGLLLVAASRTRDRRGT